MPGTILVVDDEAIILETLEGVLGDEGFEVLTASDGVQGLARVEAANPDLVLLDIWMPNLDGLQTLAQLKADHPGLPVVMMSGAGTIETAVQATKLGAFDYIEKPLSYEKILVVINNALTASRLAEENLLLRRDARRAGLSGTSPAISEVKRQIELVGPTSASVLITGENGTGKEVAAHMVHAASPRAQRPMVAVNCAAIPEELIESELFGHEKGAFTGATGRRRGKFDLADGSTIFLDEIADMSLKTQAKILRILQEQTFERVGGSRTISTDVRVVAATNRDLEDEIAVNRFREDLFYRLNVVPIIMPPLRERPDDLDDLAKLFLSQYAAKTHLPVKRLSPEAVEVLAGHDWPGNVRELKNLMERLAILTRAEIITPADLPQPYGQADPASADSPDLAAPLAEPTLRRAKSSFEKTYIQSQLARHNGNISATAEAIGVERSHLHKKIKALDINPALNRGESAKDRP